MDYENDLHVIGSNGNKVQLSGLNTVYDSCMGPGKMFQKALDYEEQYHKYNTFLVHFLCLGVE